ncbi:phage major capsid protein [Peptostreptococcus canis]|uniref:Phage major capsid protein n=1 Tax=Peptostreptococcus canis TaxID=1159213 RepID=A0ABR6TMD6_9FIRM|nr:phage major capsid protein [Peptostreptococcus canis]MBC2576572.1 phage major capsid protein [Peptostreptococcus canis]MBP1998759.1 HK97 family phage major capsid protein [Peptostreptococcus canis]
MLLSVELKKKIESKKAEMKELRDKGDIENAHNIIAEIENLNKKLEIQLKLEEDDKNHVINSGKAHEPQGEVLNKNKAFNKALNGKKLSEKEIEYVKNNLIENSVGATGIVGAEDVRGGYLLPETHETQIKELRRKRRALKDLVNVKNVTTRTGKYSTEGDNSKLELVNFEELNDLTEKDLKFGQKSWDVKDYGLLIPVANQFLQDTDINIIDYIGKEFVKAAVRTENKKIITEMKKLSAITIKGIDDLVSALNTAIDPAIAENARIITNQTSFDWLDRQKDSQGLPLLQPSLSEPTKKNLKGKIIEVFSDEELEPKTTGNLTFYVGDLEEYLTFYEKEGIEVAKSEEAGFKQNTTWLRVIERFDLGIYDDKALVLCEMKKPTA